MSAAELEGEPILGLPERLPDGERILWQGKPEWRRLARHAFKTRWLALYFGSMVAFRAALLAGNGRLVDELASLALMTLLFAAGLGIVTAIAWLHAQATVYTLTNRRVVMRFGVALSMSWNLPFRQLGSADLALHGEGDGDVVLRLAKRDRVRWVFFWPHVVGALRPSPALRGLSEPETVASALAAAVNAWAESHEIEVEVADASSLRPQLEPAAAVASQAAR